MDTVEVADLEIVVDDEVDSDAGVRPEVEDRELVVDDGLSKNNDGLSKDDDGLSENVDGLSENERQLLAFERQWWKHAGAKEQGIRDLFGVSSTRYYQMLNELLDNPAALAYDPVLVKRLRRLRATRTRARTGGK
jgi:hypothetical protein